MPDTDIKTELLSIEQFALTLEANAVLLRQKATRLRTRLENEISPAALNSGLVQKSNKAIADRMICLKRKQKTHKSS